ncbi:MAG: hypothetical protein ACI3W5_07450 [Faecousia sp.]
MSNLSESQLYEAFGIDAPQNTAGEGANTPAEPAKQELPDAAQGEKAQAVAEPAPQQEDSDIVTGDGSQTQPEGDANKRQAQSDEERKANAARRRQQEQQLAIDRAVSTAVKSEQDKASAVLADLFSRAGLKNTITGQPITNLEEFNAWETAFKAAKVESELKSGKLSRDTLDNLIAQHPTVQAAAKVVQESEDAKQKAELEAARVRVNSDIQKISQLDPSIHSMEDILALPTAEAFYKYVNNKGLSIFDAFYLANRERLETAQAEAGRQQALSNNRGKSHLTATGNSRGSGAMFVPADEMKYFRLFDPEASEAEIQAYYNKHKKA